MALPRLSGRQWGSVLNLPFQDLLLPLMQRVNEWKLFPSLAVSFPLMLHKFIARKSPSMNCE